ncbi:MAG: hypothetical protein NTZ90_08230, partial [Proteobacteria bacterium]|nr:hypothetical protein [Pseudomonadota bacterium]
DTLTGLAAMIWRQNNSSNYIRLDLRIGFDSLAGYLGGCAPSDSRRTRWVNVARGVAIAKVEGSNPFTRSTKSLQVPFVLLTPTQRIEHILLRS